MKLTTATARKDGGPANVADTADESRRRFAVKVIFFIYLLSLIEGPLRKWFLPELATPIYFIRDPFVIFIYAYCFHGRLVELTKWTRLWLIFAAFASLIGAFPFLLAGIDARAWVLGIRTYWLYMPLAFVVASTFQQSDFSRFLRLNLILAIPYAALVIAQYNASPGAWINGGIGGDEGVVFVSGFVIRPNGLFTYTGQNVNFSATLIAYFMSFATLPKKNATLRILFIFAAPAVMSLAVLSGSRSIFFVIAFMILVMVAGTVMKSVATGLKASLLLVGCVGLAAYLFVAVFSDAYEAMQVRFQTAERTEGGIENRAIFGVISFLWPLSEAPLLGHGIGLGTPGINRFFERPPQELGEAELMRVVNELGPVSGLMFVMLRFSFAAYLIVVSLRTARAGRLEFLPLAGFAALGIAQGQMTHSTLIGFSYWLTAGLVLVSLRTTTSSQSPSIGKTPMPTQRGLLTARKQGPLSSGSKPLIQRDT